MVGDDFVQLNEASTNHPDMNGIQQRTKGKRCACSFAKIEQGFSRRNHPARATRIATEVIYLAIDFIECLLLAEHGRKRCSHRSFFA